MSCNTEVRPFLLEPVGKSYLWGGNRLNCVFGKNIDLDPLAETWECSTHPDGVSLVASGEWKNTPLTALINQKPDILGEKHAASGDIPILVKLIDAKKDLSVQVHPTDEYANSHEHGQRGKTEMWYVIDTEPDTCLIYGFIHDVTKGNVKRSVENGSITRYLQKVTVEKGQVFFIPAGKVHAICAGALIAEIQQNSNLTYRLFDYDRVDINGQKRPLHIQKALDVAELKSSAEPKQPMRVLRYLPGCASELLCRCKYFQVERRLLNTSVGISSPYFEQKESFQLLLCVDGCAHVRGEGFEMSLEKGCCMFVPAGEAKMLIDGSAELLNIMC